VCGRYTLKTPDPATLRERFLLSQDVSWTARYNIAPGDRVLAVLADGQGDRTGELVVWGLVPGWAKEPQTGLRLINARAETAARRPAFRDAFAQSRCLLPADGFYEWRGSPRGAKQPFHISRRDGAIFAFAGLWSCWHGDDGQEFRSCAILTTAANDAIAPLHDRMPVILDPEGEETWLRAGADGQELHQLLHGLPAVMTVVNPVGPAVNDARYDAPDCLAAPAPARQSALF
jgi:putative SOS response-associated peptidase YedK